MSSSSASPIVIKRVADLKETLTKILNKKDEDDDSNHEQILDILTHLDKSPIDVNVLAETLIGATVSKFKSYAKIGGGEIIASKAKTLVKKWKHVAKQSGILSANNGTSSTSTKATTSSASMKKASPNANKKSKPDTGTASAALATRKATTTESLIISTNAFDHLPDFRKNSAMKLYQIFILSKSSLQKQQQNTDAVDSNDHGDLSTIISTKAKEVENAIQSYSRGQRKQYIDKIRSLIFNLKKNEPLRIKILSSQISPSTVVKMSAKELQTDEKQKEQEKELASLQGANRLDWDQANADKINEMCGIKGELLKASLFTCGRCKSHKTTSTQKQTRSADEPMVRERERRVCACICVSMLYIVYNI